MKYKDGDEVIMASNAEQHLTQYKNLGIPKSIAGFRARIDSYNSVFKEYRIRLYWKNKLIEGNGTYILRAEKYIERKVG